jgi:transposase-like protein
MDPRCRIPVRRHGGYHPPHCPNPECAFHHPRPDWHYIRDGFFTRPSDRRRVQCFQCRHCNRNFSTQTFSVTYWLRRPDLFRRIAFWALEGPALRQAARVLGVSHNTVARHLARLGRHCLLFHLRFLEDPSFRLREPLVIDGFESFEFSQYFPFHLNLAVGAESHFLYHFNDAPLRRKGTMTPYQKKRRAELEVTLGRPDPKAIEKAVYRLIRDLRPLLPEGETLTLHSDDHPAYRRALRSLRSEPGGLKVSHCVTSSLARRTTRNPLFPVNLADLLLRHGSANHRRETIAFSKRRQAACERAAVFLVWRNYVKRWSEKAGEETAAMRAGILNRPLEWREILRRRLFPRHRVLPTDWREYYARRVRTAVFGARQSAHVLRLAF